MWAAYLNGAALHVPGTGVTVSNPSLKQGRNAADSFTFSIPVTHPLYDACVNGIMTAKYTVEKDGETVSRGRILSRTINPFDSVCKVECEGELAYLNDAVLDPYDFSGAPRELLSMMLDQYNAQCDPDNRIMIGNVTAYDPNDYIVRGSKKPVNCMTELIAKTAESSTGGWLNIRWDGGNAYLDWLNEPTATGNQSIAKGSNLLDISDALNGAELVTAIMPIGASTGADFVRLPDSPDGQISGDVYRRGKFVYSKALTEKYGWHAELREWGDVTTTANLRSRAISAVRELAFSSLIDVSALDLSDAGYTVDRFRIGQRVAVACDSIEGEMIVTGATWALDNPAKSSFSFGSQKSLTKKAAASSAAADSGGWSNYGDISNYGWHETGTRSDGSKESERTFISSISKYDLDEGVPEAWNFGKLRDAYPVPFIEWVYGYLFNNLPPFGNLRAAIGNANIHGVGGEFYYKGGAVSVRIKRQDHEHREGAGYVDNVNASDNLIISWNGLGNNHSIVLGSTGIDLNGTVRVNGTPIS